MMIAARKLLYGVFLLLRFYFERNCCLVGRVWVVMRSTVDCPARSERQLPYGRSIAAVQVRFFLFLSFQESIPGSGIRR